MFYIPGCPRCRDLAPKWNDLAAIHYKDDENLVIAVMDASNNEARDVTLVEAPRINFYPKGNKKLGITFPGNFEYEDI